MEGACISTRVLESNAHDQATETERQSRVRSRVEYSTNYSISKVSLLLELYSEMSNYEVHTKYNYRTKYILP